MTGNKEHREIVGLPILDQFVSTLLRHVTLSSFLPRAEELDLMSSIAWAMSVGRASSQKGANECTTSEGYSHTWCMRHRQGGYPSSEHPKKQAAQTCFSSFTLSSDSLPEAPSGPEFLLSDLSLVKTFLMLHSESSSWHPSGVDPSSWTPNILELHRQHLDAEPTGPTEAIFPLVGAPLAPHFLPEM